MVGIVRSNVFLVTGPIVLKCLVQYGMWSKMQRNWLHIFSRIRFVYQGLRLVVFTFLFLTCALDFC